MSGPKTGMSSFHLKSAHDVKKNVDIPNCLTMANTLKG